MNIALWIVQGLLSLAFAGAAGINLAKSKAEFEANPRMGWARDFSAGQIRLIGLAEVAGASVLILPAALGIAPILTPIAALCLLVLMVGAAVIHARRKEPPVPPLVLSALALMVAAGRFAAST